MRSISIIKADDLKDWDILRESGEGWHFARPEGYYGGILRRFRLAWMVFTGKADVLQWYKQ